MIVKIEWVSVHETWLEADACTVSLFPERLLLFVTPTENKKVPQIM